MIFPLRTRTEWASANCISRWCLFTTGKNMRQPNWMIFWQTSGGKEHIFELPVMFLGSYILHWDYIYNMSKLGISFSKGWFSGSMLTRPPPHNHTEMLLLSNLGKLRVSNKQKNGETKNRGCRLPQKPNILQWKNRPFEDVCPTSNDFFCIANVSLPEVYVNKNNSNDTVEGAEIQPSLPCYSNLRKTDRKNRGYSIISFDTQWWHLCQADLVWTDDHYLSCGVKTNDVNRYTLQGRITYLTGKGKSSSKLPKLHLMGSVSSQEGILHPSLSIKYSPVMGRFVFLKQKKSRSKPIRAISWSWIHQQNVFPGWVFYPLGLALPVIFLSLCWPEDVFLTLPETNSWSSPTHLFFAGLWMLIIPLYWLFNMNPCNGLLYNPQQLSENTLASGRVICLFDTPISWWVKLWRASDDRLLTKNVQKMTTILIGMEKTSFFTKLMV